ncbi:MAG: DUF4276 family protein [Chloroflexi bacterium]|nr:DUF4276 family protein [Chloroflexota bacterium]
MRKVLISVEGQTEETFVRRVLQPHLAPRGLWPEPSIIKTRRAPTGPDYRGGYVPYARIRREIMALLGDTSAVAVTTMYDLYALPADFPGLNQSSPGSAWDKVALLEAEFRRDLGSRKFRPYLQVHEFEALLFADVAKTCADLQGTGRHTEAMERILSDFGSPEEIDDDPDTSPSRRIKRLLPRYEKVLHGPTIAAAIGLDALRRKCLHFGEWLTWLEGLARQ